MGRNIRYILHWKEPNGAKGSAVSPYVEHRGLALKWLLDMKPYLIWHLKNIKIRAWNRSIKP
jgi:hypothetical protein